MILCITRYEKVSSIVHQSITFPPLLLHHDLRAQRSDKDSFYQWTDLSLSKLFTQERHFFDRALFSRSNLGMWIFYSNHWPAFRVPFA